MKLRKYRMPVLGVLVLIFLSGCAVSENYKIGQELIKGNRWEESIGYFEKALSESPDNQEYKEALVKAKQETAKIYYEKAKAALANVPERNIPALEQVVKQSSRAYSFDPQNKDIKVFHENLKENINTLNKTVKSLYGQAESDMKKEDWMSALAKLKQISAMYPNYEDTGNKMAKIVKELYQLGIKLGKQEEWKMAAQAFKAAMDINPGYYDVEKRYRDAISKDNADYFVAGAEIAEKAQEWGKAISLFERAVEYQGENQALLKKVDSLKAKTGQIYFEEACKLVEQGKLYAAFKKIELVKVYTPSLQRDSVYKDFVSKFCAKLMERADKYLEKEMWGNALVWLQEVEVLNPGYPEFFQKMLETKDQINKRIKKSIAVFDFGSPSTNKDAGKIAANKLITYLHRKASGDLRIIERENLQSILREMQLGQTGIVDVKSAQTAKMRGIDTFILGDVLHFSTKLIDYPTTSQIKVLVDEEDVRNPEFSDWLMTHRNPTDEELKTAPPRTIKKKNFQFVPHKQGIARINAMIEISYKLVDTATGENIFTNTISGKLVKEDKYQDAVPAANIPSKQLELPTEAEVIDELTTEKISEMGQSVLKQYQSLEVEYFNQGEQQRQRRRNYDLAIERYTDAIFDEKLKSISTTISQKAQEMIDKLVQNK